MKRLGLCIGVLCCILFGGCLGSDEEDFSNVENKGDLTPPLSVEMVTPTVVPTLSAEITVTVPLTMPTAEITPSITPTLSVQVALSTPTPSLTPTPKATSTPSATPTVPILVTSTPTPVVTEEFDIKKLGLEAYVDVDGKEIYEASTCFFDENGLLCVGLKAVYDKDSDICEIEKSYYLPNAILYREAKQEKGMDALQVFEDRIVEETHVTRVYEPIVFETISGYVWTTKGEMVKASELLGEDYASKFVCTKKEGYIPVAPGEKIRMDFYFSWFSQIGGVVFLDENDRLVETYSFNSTTQVKDQFIVVPEKAEKMHLSLFINQTYRLERQLELVGADLKAIDEKSYIGQSMALLQEVPKMSIKQYELDKAYITFVLDDCRPDMDKVADIFQEYEVPLCIAAVHENLLFSASEGGETRRQVCERVVANGGEVLAHDAEVITNELTSDYAGLVKHFCEDKWILEQMGFDVNGIILAGGADQVIGHESTDIWARTFYQYSDLYGRESYGEPYYHRRFWLGNCLDTYEQVIENAIAEKKWIVLYLHDLKEVNSEKLQEILQYVNSLRDEDVEVVTYKTLYDKMW